MITVNIIKPINEVILKQDKIEVLIDKKNVELLTIDKVILKEIYGNADTYSREEIDNKLNEKIDIPTVPDWANFDLILSM